MALKWPAGLWRKTEEDGCVSREEDGGQGAAALIFSFFSKGRGRWPLWLGVHWFVFGQAKGEERCWFRWELPKWGKVPVQAEGGGFLCSFCLG